MLKWETYQKMKAKDKEEWNYRFKDNIEYHGASSPVLSIVVIWLVFQSTLMVYFLMMKEYVDVALGFSDALVYISSIAFVMLIVWLISLSIGLISLVYWNLKAQKWLKLKGYR